MKIDWISSIQALAAVAIVFFTLATVGQFGSFYELVIPDLVSKRASSSARE